MSFAPRIVADHTPFEPGSDVDLLLGFAPLCRRCLTTTVPVGGRRGVWWHCVECTLPRIG